MFGGKTISVWFSQRNRETDGRGVLKFDVMWRRWSLLPKIVLSWEGGSVHRQIGERRPPLFLHPCPSPHPLPPLQFFLRPVLQTPLTPHCLLFAAPPILLPPIATTVFQRYGRGHLFEAETVEGNNRQCIYDRGGGRGGKGWGGNSVITGMKMLVEANWKKKGRRRKRKKERKKEVGNGIIKGWWKK